MPPVLRPTSGRAGVVVGALLLGLVAALVGGLAVLVAIGPRGATPGATPSPSGASIAYAELREAPPIELIDPDGRPFSLAALRGDQVLVFFGYTHCPDVCPATIGVVGQVLAKVGTGTRAVFVSIDPERDTTTWLKEYVQYLPTGFTALTGDPARIRATADAWGVRYARVETDSKDTYSMSHTADVFLVDAAGRLRAHFPFGTGAQAMAQVVEAVAATPSPLASGAAPSPTPIPSPTPTPNAAGSLRPEVVSTSVWAGGRSPVILALNDAAGRLNDPALRATVQLRSGDGHAVGGPVDATTVRPPGVAAISYVATLDIPGPGRWRLDVSASGPGKALAGSVDITALDPGATAALGLPAPAVRTPTLDDVGGDPHAITTDPQPDLRLSRRSTSDALDAHQPFVLVVDSVRFRVSVVCGKAVFMARYLADRWPDVAFIHLEPFRYSLVSDSPLLSGDISDPPLGPVAAAWGIGGAPWGALSVPWVFVVDGNGVVRAKYQGLMGSADIDVMLSLITGQP